MTALLMNPFLCWRRGLPLKKPPKPYRGPCRRRSPAAAADSAVTAESHAAATCLLCCAGGRDTSPETALGIGGTLLGRKPTPSLSLECPGKIQGSEPASINVHECSKRALCDNVRHGLLLEGSHSNSGRGPLFVLEIRG